MTTHACQVQMSHQRWIYGSPCLQWHHWLHWSQPNLERKMETLMQPWPQQKSIQPSNKKEHMGSSINVLIKCKTGETIRQPIHQTYKLEFIAGTLLLLPHMLREMVSSRQKDGCRLVLASLPRPQPTMHHSSSKTNQASFISHVQIWSTS